MPKYRKKPVVIEAVQYTGTNTTEIKEFVTDKNVLWREVTSRTCHGGFIVTLEGDMEFKVGDYIIRGVKGEYCPCREDIFLATYESVE